jgi:uncharacterized membrane protein
MLQSHRSAMFAATPIRRFKILLAVAYPVVAHLAVVRASITLTVTAIALLIAVAMLPALARGSTSAWLSMPVLGAALWSLSRSMHPMLPLYIAPVLVPAFMAWVFGQSLLAGQTPLISQLIRALHPPGEEPEAAVWPYARALTLSWTALFIALAATNLLLAALAEPDGLLLAGGITPPITVPQEWWSLFANFIGYLLVAGFFLAEYVYRRRRFPRQPYRNLLDFLQRMLAAMPKLVAQSSAAARIEAPARAPDA